MAVAQKKKKIFDGRYEVLEIVGRGACSVVYHARHAMTSTSEVALKVLLNQKGGTSNTDKLRKEALAMVSSRHRYVVRLDDFHSVKDLCYLSMEYANEGDLRKYRAKFGGKLPLPVAERFFSQVAEALSFVHRVGIIHRDIKPDNILVLNENEIRLTDFGVAVLPGEIASFDELRSGIGTMSYMAPEVLEGTRCDKLSDIYALGVSFYEMISGVHPFESAPLIKQLDVRQDEVVTPISKLVPGIPANLAEAITKAMKYDSTQRFQTVGDLLKVLTAQPAQDKPSLATQIEKSVDSPASSFQTPPPVVPYPSQPQAAMAGGGMGQIAVASQGAMAPSAAISESPSANGSSTAHGIDDDLDDDLESDLDESLEELNDDLDDPVVLDETPTYSDKPSVSPNRKADNEPLRDKPRLAPNSDRVHAPLYFNLFIGVLILFAGNYLLGKIFGLHLFSSTPGTEPAVSSYQASNIIPSVSEDIASFPNLPAGLYRGTLETIASQKDVPLMILSVPEKQKLIVTVGIDGWTPDVLNTGPGENGQPSAVKGNKLRVASNGLVIDLQGEVSDGGVVGKYRENVSGDEGSWQLSPLK